MIDPTRHREHPEIPIFPSRSPRKIAARTALRGRLLARVEWEQRSQTHPTRTDSAPSGVTRAGGAKVYAAKLATVREAS